MPIIAPTPIDAAPDAPDKNDRATFSLKAYNWALYQKVDLQPGINALGTNVYNNALEVQTLAGTATASEAAAVAAAAAATGAANVNGTSATNRTPAGGSMTWVYVEAGKTPFPGQRMRAASRANLTTNFAGGTVTAYDAGTKTVTVLVDLVGPVPATAADWNLILEGEPGEGAELITPTVTFGATGTLVHGDAGASVVVTATSTVTPDTPAALGDNWSVFFPAAAYAITIPGTYTDGAATKTLAIGSVAVLQSTGAALRLTYLAPGDHEVTVHTGNGMGAVNTKNRRFTTVQRNVGGAITYAESANDAASFTIAAGHGGLYQIHYAEDHSSAIYYGVSLNSASLTTSVISLSTAERVLLGEIIGSGSMGNPIVRTLRLAAGDVIRPHASAALTGTNAGRAIFSIRKVGL